MDGGGEKGCSGDLRSGLSCPPSPLRVLCGRRLQAEAVAASARHKDTPLTPIPARGEIWPGGNGEF